MHTILSKLNAVIAQLESEGKYAQASELNDVFSAVAKEHASGDPTVKAIIEYVKTIKHCGDYGSCWWNPETKSAHWTAGDSDGYDPHDESPLTSLSEIENKLKAIKGVDHVEIGDEWSPSEEDGFVNIYP